MKQKIKIVATIGPVSANPNMLKKMYEAGMSVARLNGSHNTLDWHSKNYKINKTYYTRLSNFIRYSWEEN